MAVKYKNAPPTQVIKGGGTVTKTKKPNPEQGTWSFGNKVKYQEGPIEYTDGVNPHDPNAFPGPGGVAPTGPTTGPGLTYPGTGGGGGTGSIDPSQWQDSGAFGFMQDLYNKSTGGTINSFNTAANRLRERTDSMTGSNIDALTKRNLGRGFGNSGFQDMDILSAQLGGQNAYAQGFSDLADKFESQRQQGLSNAANVTGQMGGLESNKNSALIDLLKGDRSNATDIQKQGMQSELQKWLAQFGAKTNANAADQNSTLDSILQMLKKFS